MTDILTDPAFWLWSFGSAVISAFTFWLLASSLAHLSKAFVLAISSITPILIMLGMMFAVQASRSNSFRELSGQIFNFFNIEISLGLVLFWVAGILGAFICWLILVRRANKPLPIDQVFE